MKMPYVFREGFVFLIIKIIHILSEN